MKENLVSIALVLVALVAYDMFVKKAIVKTV